MAEYLRNRGNIRGVDISNWQPNINYQALKNAGVEIAIIKATEANYYKDPYMEKHYNGCKSVGIKVGFYHFFRCNVDAKAQAQYFVNYIQGKSYDVKLVLDIESTEGQSKSTITNMARTFLEEVQRLTGTQPMIYTYTSFANSCLDGSLSVYPKWMAQYSPLNPSPCSLCDSNGWDGFQFASDGLIANSGYTNLDINEFKPSVYLDGKTVSTGAPVQVSQPTQSTVTRNWTYQYDPQILELQKILNGKGKGFNLVEDGKMGEATYAALCNYTFDNGDKGELCKWIQNRLNSLGFNCGTVDGVIGTNTVNAIHAWQKANGLGEGYLGGSDFYVLCREPVGGTQVNQVTQQSDNANNRVWRNRYDAQIAELQQVLNVKGHGLVVDGIMGEKTYASVTQYTIEKGDKGELTRWVQKRLNTMQYNAGDEDGIAGDNTMSAIARFQASYGLGTGYLGGGDWYYLTNR